MPYTVVAEKLKTVPDEYLEDVSDFIDYITVHFGKDSESDNAKKLRKVYGSKSEIPQVPEAGLEVIQEILKDDTW